MQCLSGGLTVSNKIVKQKKSSQRQSSSFDNSSSNTQDVYHLHQQSNMKPKYPVPEPETLHMDALACMLDEEIYSRLNSLENDRQKVIEARFDPRKWEEEICYVRRELAMRRERHMIHENYIHNQIRNFSEEEANLPSANFDNVKYMVN